MCGWRLPRHLLLHSQRAGTTWWTARTIAQLPHINLELGDGAAEGVAVHAQFAGGAALVAFVFLQDGKDELLLEFADRLGIQDVAFVHLHDQSFQLIFHGVSLSMRRWQLVRAVVNAQRDPLAEPSTCAGTPRNNSRPW